MAAIEQSIPNMLGGVSQQPDPVKLSGQVREAENVFLDPTFGCLKRPGTEWVANLAAAGEIPTNGRWFPIFRDTNEKYMVCIYRTEDAAQDLIVRVWDAFDGTELSVTVDPFWQEYADSVLPRNFKFLTIADYTLLCNTRSATGTNIVDIEDPPEESLILINSVAYNTNYSIDLSSPDAQPTITTRASKISISPSAWIDDDETCGFDGSETFTVDHNYWNPNGPNTVPVESGESADGGGPGPGVGLSFRVVTQGTAQRQEDTDDEYECRYKTDVILLNGGNGWRVGDRIKVEADYPDGKDYWITVEEVQEFEVFADLGIASFTTPADAQAGALALDTVTAGLIAEIEQIADFTAQAVGNVIRIRRTNNTKFQASGRGGVADNAISSINKTAADVSQLPSQCFDEYYLEIVNTEDAEADNYYVEFVSDVPGRPGPGTWQECVKRGQEEYPNPSGMPHALIRQADGNFTLGPIGVGSEIGEWGGRVVGDENTNPNPTFIGNRIQDMFLHRNRLGFLTAEAAVLSQPGDFFNFYATSGVAISDADPVDMSASDTKPVILKDAISTTEGVVLLGEQAQFRLFTAESTFGPNTVELKKISSHDYVSRAEPQLTNVSVMFNTEAGEFTKVYEMATASLRQGQPQISENTRTVPRYIPTGIRWSAASPNNDLVSYGDGKDIYSFRFFNQGDERQVAGWTKWTFAGKAEFAAYSGDDLFLIRRQDDGTVNLERMVLLDGPDSPIDVEFTQFRPRVDAQIPSSDLVSLGDSTLANGRKITTWQVPAGYQIPLQKCTLCFTDVRTGEFDTVLVGDNDRFIADQGREFILGYEYESKLELPTFYVKTDNRADRITNPMVQRLYVDLFNSGALKMDIDVNGYPTRTIDLPTTEANNYSASAVVVIENYTAEVDIYQRGEDTYVTIYSTTPFPTSLTSYNWQGTYQKRGYGRI